MGLLLLSNVIGTFYFGSVIECRYQRGCTDWALICSNRNIYNFFKRNSIEMNYSNREMADIHYYYGLARGSSERARILYAEHFPQRRIPNPRTFAAIHRRLRENGSFSPFRRGIGRPARDDLDDIADQILQRVELNPAISIRRLVAEFNIPYSTIWRILHREHLYPYHLQRVQALEPQDYPNRLGFCQWFISQPLDFGWNVLFTDEAQFTRDGINNFHNTHLWLQENPHAVVQNRHQRHFSLNVWAGIVGDHLLGPVFLPPILNGATYRNFLLDSLPLLLEDVPIRVRREMWFMHDGAPAHFSLVAREVLDRENYYRNRWIGRGGPIAWPARSPDLNPLDFFLWGHCKSLVYSQAVQSQEDLRQRIIDAFQDVIQTHGMLQRVNGSLYRRLEACILTNGGHIEQLL